MWSDCADCQGCVSEKEYLECMDDGADACDPDDPLPEPKAAEPTSGEAVGANLPFLSFFFVKHYVPPWDIIEHAPLSEVS